MAKKTRFALEVKNGVQARTLEDIQENFDLEKIALYFGDGRLKMWLEGRYYDEEAKEVGKLSKNDPKLTQKLCKILGVNIKTVEAPTANLEKITRRRERLEKLGKYTDDENLLSKVDNAAFEQEELLDLLDENVVEILLCDNTFRIPITEKNKKYIGVGKAIAVIKSDKTVNFKDLNIEFVNVKFDDKYEKILNAANNKADELSKAFATAVADYKNGNYEGVFPIFKNAAESGNVEAMRYLGEMYYDGNGVEQNLELAYKWIRKAADLGNYEAIALLGLMYWGGDYVEKDERWAIKLLTQAAENGNVEAMHWLGAIYHQGGTLISQDFSEARKWYLKAIELGDSDSMVGLGLMYRYGEGVKSDSAEAKKWLKKAADLNNTAAMYVLAGMYRYGEGSVTINPNKAFDLMKKASDAGNWHASFELGDMYCFGEGTQKNEAMAIELFKKYIEDDDKDIASEAMFRIGRVYYAKDTVTACCDAFPWFEKAVKLDHIKAMTHLGYMYENGLGTRRNTQKSVEWLEKAADKGDTEAMNLLADIYYDENNTRKDYTKALAYLIKAANAGDSDAMWKLGYFYLHGVGVSKNPNEALSWFQKCADAGNLEGTLGLGRYYEECQNFSSALKYYVDAANAGNSDAMITIGRFYLKGKGVKEDLDIAKKWFNKAKTAGHHEADEGLKNVSDAKRNGILGYGAGALIGGGLAALGPVGAATAVIGGLGSLAYDYFKGKK